MSDSSLKAVVFAAISHARLQSRRLLSTHFGLANRHRTVIDELPLDLAGNEMYVGSATTDSEQERHRQIVLAQIKEFTSSPKHQELIVRRLFHGDNIVDVAEELGINPSSARSIVMRARRHLCLGD